MTTQLNPAGYGKEAAVELLLRLGADPSAASDRSGMAALARAAARSHAGALRLLLAAGADPWQRSAAGQTPLMYASQFGHSQALELLLQHLASGEQPGESGGDVPAGQGSTSTSGGDVPAGQGSTSTSGGGGGGSGGSSSLRRHLALCDGAGLSALHLAAQWGMAGVARQLLQAGAGGRRLGRRGAGADYAQMLRDASLAPASG